MPTRTSVTRRGALAAAASLPLVHIRTAAAAGKLALGLWDHSVPAGNPAMRRIIDAWATRNKVEVSVDFITSVNNNHLFALAAEAQAGVGHDVMALPTWEVRNHRQKLEPVDDVVEGLIRQYGAINPVVEYISKVDGRWMAVPSSSGSQHKAACARISLFRQGGLDPRAMYPAQADGSPLAGQWTWDRLLDLAPLAQTAGMPFALGLGATSDSVDFVGSVFRSFGADLVNAQGEISVKSDAVRSALDYMVKLAKYLPADVYSYDDAANNRALIAGKSALIFNPPSAWFVARRDAPAVAQDCWTFPTPAGPNGRFVPYFPFFWGIWTFARNKSAARDLLAHLCQREQVAALCEATAGYDIPPFLSMSDFDVWSRQDPPAGTLFNYPLRPAHAASPSITAFPAPPEIAVQIYNRATMTTMVAKVTQRGETIERALAWAQDELEGFAR